MYTFQAVAEMEIYLTKKQYFKFGILFNIISVFNFGMLIMY
jgi:hypothetical protein